MKSKITSLLMFFITIAIICATILLGMILWKEISSELKTGNITNQSQEFTLENQDDPEPEGIQNIEVPEIRNNTNNNPLEVNSAEETKEIDYENIIVNKYFFSQLDSYSQKIYKAFETNKTNMQTGTYKINLGSSFSNILSKEDGQSQLGRYYQSAIEAYIYDNPDVFYLNTSKMFLNIETTTRGSQKTYNVYIDCGEESNYLIDEFNSPSEVKEAIEKIENVRNMFISKKSGNTYRDIKMAHDYLVENIKYDTSISNQNVYNVYGALVNNRCVCEGYAKALKYLLDGLGIESTIVIGKANNSAGSSENHAWNYVKLEDNWYAIDSTWDDPIIIGGGFLGNDSKYKYFLKGSKTMSENHFPSGKFTEGGKEFEYPVLSTRDY